MLGFTRHQELLLSLGVTSPGSGHIQKQAGGLGELTPLCSKECKSIWFGGKRWPETGQVERGVLECQC